MHASCTIVPFPQKRASKALAVVVVGGGVVSGFTVGLAFANERSVHLSLHMRRKSIYLNREERILGVTLFTCN